MSNPINRLSPRSQGAPKYRLPFSAALLGLIAIAGCSNMPSRPPMGQSFTITSTGFEDGGMLARKFAGNTKGNPNCIGDNVSPQFSWTNVPAGTKSFALVMVDPEGRGGLGVIHWVAYGISASINSFAEGELSQLGSKYVGGKGTAGMGHYLGPCTPPVTGLLCDIHPQRGYQVNDNQG
jgi:phosphatidylethanolamine-binding protein (PEBP) family uncharacterized protein